MCWRKLYGPENKYLTTHSILKESLTEEDDVYGTTYHGCYTDENAIVQRCHDHVTAKKVSPTLTHTDLLQGDPPSVKEKSIASPTFISSVQLEYPENELVPFASNRTPSQYLHTPLWGKKAQLLNLPDVKVPAQYPHTPLWGKEAVHVELKAKYPPSNIHKHTDIFNNASDNVPCTVPPSQTYTHTPLLGESDIQQDDLPIRSSVSDTYTSTPLWGVTAQPLEKSEAVSPTHVHTNIFVKSDVVSSNGNRPDRNTHTPLWGAKARLPVVEKPDKVSMTHIHTDLFSPMSTEDSLDGVTWPDYTHTPFWSVEEEVRGHQDKVSPTYHHTPIWNSPLVSAADTSEKSSIEDEKQEQVKAGAGQIYSHTPLW